jgi:hypothetical protein
MAHQTWKHQWRNVAALAALSVVALTMFVQVEPAGAGGALSGVASTALSAKEIPPTADLPVTNVYQTRVIGLLSAKARDTNWARSEILFDQTFSLPPASAEVQNAFDAARAATQTRAQSLANETGLVLDSFQSATTLLANSTWIQKSSVIHDATYLVNANATYHKRPCTWILWMCV